jgi:lipid-binding SYLF domain-containing protein
VRSCVNAFLTTSFSALVGLSLTTTSSATPATVEDELLRNAILVFDRAVDTPATAIPTSIMMRARAIAVIPAAAKDGAVYYGLGVLSARGVGPEAWTPPAIIGFQGAIPIDLRSTTVDFVLVAQSPRGVGYLTQHRFDSPVTNPIAPGPVRQDTPERVGTDVLAYIQFGGYFAGVTIEDWGVSEMRSNNEQLYGRPFSTDDIMRGSGFFRLPAAAHLWRDTLVRYFREMS